MARSGERGESERRTDLLPVQIVFGPGKTNILLSRGFCSFVIIQYFLSALLIKA